MKHFIQKISLKSAQFRVSFISAAMMLLGYPVSAAGGETNLGQSVLTESKTKLSELLDSLVELLQVVMGLGAIVVLAIVIFKVFKGDREAAEKLAWWVAGLTLGFTLMTVVKGLIS